MGYRVEYGTVKKVRGLERCRVGWPALTGAVFLFFLLLVTSLWPEGAETLRQLLIPGDWAVTTAAVEEMTEDLRSGASVQEALGGFCSEILEEAGFVLD